MRILIYFKDLLLVLRSINNNLERANKQRHDVLYHLNNIHAAHSNYHNVDASMINPRVYKP